LAPTLFALDTELIEVGPGVDAGVVQIVEGDAHGIIADRLEPEPEPDDPDMRTAGNWG
jgi:hypothetical protein